jgi:heme oxygenase
LEKLNELPATREDYVAQLGMFFGFVAPWEDALAHALPGSDPIRAGRSKTAWLEEDLAFFGVDAAQRAALPTISALPSLRSRPEILGAAYVLEGSTLGGQIISDYLERTLGLSDGRGYRYFRSYGREVGARWQAFRTELMHASSAENDAAILRGAADTFRLLHAWFAEQKALAA